jgi:fucose 4-O-acetylase-like acetyltransferase
MNNPKKIGFFLLLSSIAGYFYGLFIDKSLPWSIDICFMALVFYGCGYLFKNHSAIFESKFLNQKTFYIFLFANILFGQINKRINMWGNDYGNYLLFFVAAFSGIMATIIIVRTIKYKKIMSLIGKNSFIYMALHQVIALNILKFLSDTILRALNITLDQNTFIARFLLGIIFTVGSIIIIYPFVDIINKHFPFILGRSKINPSLPINKADETELEILT